MNKVSRYSILLFALLLASSHVYSQEGTVLKGQIIDAETGKAISYATAEIRSKHLGAAANAEGIIKVSLSDSLINEMLTFSALAYTSRQIPVNKLLQDQPFVVQLTKKVYTLTELTVREPGQDKMQLGNFTDNTEKVGGYSASTGFLIAVFMDNNKGCKGIIKSISIYIKKRDRFIKPYPKTPFRVRIFVVDTLTKGPGLDLLTDNLIVKPKGAGWFTIDVSKYNIEAPEDGYFAAMEWVFTKEKYYYIITLQDNTKIAYGQSLGSMIGDYAPNTWVKYLGYNWEFRRQKIGGRFEGLVQNALINSEIDCFK